MAHNKHTRDRRLILAWAGLALSIVSMWDVYDRRR
jgi:hypothetical protein